MFWWKNHVIDHHSGKLSEVHQKTEKQEHVTLRANMATKHHQIIKHSKIERKQ